MMLDNKFDYMYRVFGKSDNHLSVILYLIKRLALLYEDLYVKNLLANERSIVYLVNEMRAINSNYVAAKLRLDSSKAKQTLVPFMNSIILNN